MVPLSDLSLVFVAGTLGRGGAERQLYYILQALSRHGASVRLLCMTQGEYWESRIESLGVTVTFIGHQRSRASRLRLLAQELRRTPCNVVQSQHFFTNSYTAIAGRWCGVRDVGALRNDLWSEVKDAGRVLGWLSLLAPRWVVANSQAAVARARAVPLAGLKLAYLPNAVDTSMFRARDGGADADPVLMTVGRLVPQKRIDRFLRVLAAVRGRTQCRLRGLVIGTGPMLEPLRALAGELGLLPGGVEFIGASDSVQTQYTRNRIFVLTSDHEGTPNVVLEAMASELPVVATRVGDVPHLVTDGITGLTVDADAERVMVDRVTMLVADRELRRRLGAAARRQVIGEHGLETLGDRLQRLYGRVLYGRGQQCSRSGMNTAAMGAPGVAPSGSLR